MAELVDRLLDKLALLIADGRHEPLETDTIEIKPVPSDAGSWKERHKTVNAFLNTHGGILVLGFEELVAVGSKAWKFTGYHEAAEPNIKEFAKLFTDREGAPLDLTERIRSVQLRPFNDGHAAIIFIDELPADQKYAFLNKTAWKRVLTGDHRIDEAEIGRQEEYKRERWNARELETIPKTSVNDIDLDALNHYIQQLNLTVKVETLKPDLPAALPFLDRKKFLTDGTVTTLGMLVCGRHPEDWLGFRCHVHGYVDVPHEVAQDKQDIIGNILPVMERSLAYLLRNIQVGISTDRGGTAEPQYPEEVLRETVNNALAHRDYSIDKQAILTINPGVSIVVRNPGAFRPHLLIQHGKHAVPLRRIIPEAKARNPKLADVLRVYRKWEGKGIGMATLVNLCLENRIDIPTYRLYSEEVSLTLSAGQLVGERMRMHLDSFDEYIKGKLGVPPSDEQLRVLAYLIKSEWANRREQFTILLTPDNNHFEELLTLEKAGLIHAHELSPELYTIYIVDRVLVQEDCRQELEELFGIAMGDPGLLDRQCLDVLWRRSHYSSQKAVTAKSAAYSIWYSEHGGIQDLKKFDAFYRRVRRAFNELQESGFIIRHAKPKAGFVLNKDRREHS